MGAKIMLTGRAREVEKGERSVSFTIITGPATQHPPRGLKLFDQTTYRVECTVRQWRRARHGSEDETPMIVEGYLEPRRDPQTGQMYVAVVATAVCSTLRENVCKLDQLREILDEKREAFRSARSAGANRQTLEAHAAAFVEANEAVQAFLASHPELDRRR